MKRSLKDYLLISAKGIAMGAADVVPGVSGPACSSSELGRAGAEGTVGSRGDP